GKTETVFLRSMAKGRPLDAGLQEALDEMLGKLPIPKVMSYAGPGGYYNDTKFVRPAHRLVVMHGSRIVGVSAMGLNAGRIRAGRMAARLHRWFRSRVSFGPAGMPHPDHAAEPEVFCAFRRQRKAAEPIPSGEQHRHARARYDHPGQRTCASCPSRRREVLFR